MSQAYKDSGVDIEAGTRAVELMKRSVESTFNPSVLSKLGDFGGLYDLAQVIRDNEAPVLVASTDGVGTKVEVAKTMGRWDTVGQCLVNHCVNDILVQGAYPLFFLDFIGCRKLDPQVVSDMVQGMAFACKENGIALLGGETAEMGSVYGEGGWEVAGTIVGAVDKSQILTGADIQAGDHVLALPSSGLHTNGYTLARKICQDLDWGKEMLEGRALGSHLLDVHRCYLSEIRKLRGVSLNLRGLAHVTGGGIPGNFQRILPKGLGAELSLGELNMPPIFSFLRERGQLSFEDSLSAFNLGVGMILVIPPEEEKQARELLPELVRLGTVSATPGVRVSAP